MHERASGTVSNRKIKALPVWWFRTGFFSAVYHNNDSVSVNIAEKENRGYYKNGLLVLDIAAEIW